MRTDGKSLRAAWLVIGGLLAFMLLLAGCGGGGDETSGEELTKLGKGEGQVNLISWAGYVEPEWTKPFEQKTGCKVNNKVGGTSDEMVQLMRTGEYDGVSASGNATARLFEGGDVDPVNVDLVPNYKTVFSDLKDQPYNTFDGKPYGIPHARGANLLMWNSDTVKPAPTSWNVTLDPKVASKYKGKISQYDDPMSIAEAAVYLKAHQPDLGIEDPYELNEEQFEAAVNLMKEQRPLVGEYWSEAEKQISAFASGDNRRDDVAVPVLPAKGRRQAGGCQPGEPGLPAEGGCDRLVGHLDDQLRSRTSQLHVHVDGLDHRTESQRPGLRILRRGAGAGTGLRRDEKQEFLHRISRRKPGVLEAGLLLADAARRLRQRVRRLQGLQRLGAGLDLDQGLIDRS